MRRPLLVTFALVTLCAAALLAQQQQQPQNIPDAPSATRPANPLADAPKAPVNQHPEESRSTDQAAEEATPVQTPTVQPQKVPQPNTKAAEELYTLTRQVNFVVVPVTVKDSNGRLVDGLLQNDFSIYEDGQPQRITYFSSEPFPLAAAVLVDINMPDTDMRRVRDGLQALSGAFSQYDEISLYTYGGSVERVLDFNSVGRELDLALARVQQRAKGAQGGVPVVGGPMTSGPSVNGEPYDRGQQARVPIIPRERHVMNDAIFQAALELAKQPKSRRRMIFVISNGREDGSRTSYADTLKTLLGNEISVFAIATGTGATPGLRTLERINVPFTGNSNILPKYSVATGGQVFEEFSTSAIQQAYAEVALEARNQYTLGYTTPQTVASNYRQIEVLVHRRGLKISAKDGYYPLPAQSPAVR